MCSQLVGVGRKPSMQGCIIKASGMKRDGDRKEWTVWIKDVGAVVVTADDIDGAYLSAAKQYGCSTDDISAVFWQANNASGGGTDTSAGKPYTPLASPIGPTSSLFSGDGFARM